MVLIILITSPYGGQTKKRRFDTRCAAGRKAHGFVHFHDASDTSNGVFEPNFHTAHTKPPAPNADGVDEGAFRTIAINSLVPGRTITDACLG